MRQERRKGDGEGNAELKEEETEGVKRKAGEKEGEERRRKGD